VRVAVLALAVACHKGEPADAFRATPAAGLEVAMCSAYNYEPDKTHAFVMQPDGTPGDIVSWQGHAYNIHRGDCLRFSGADIRAIRWHPAESKEFVGIQLADEPGDRLSERTERRMSQLDAIFINNSLHTISLYENILRDTLWISGKPETMRALFTQLSGVEPPR